MATGEKKLRQMEEEMNRFEAEIAHQVTVPAASAVPAVPSVPTAPAIPVAPITGGFSFTPTATAFIPHQLRVPPSIPVPAAVPMYVPLVQPTVPAYPRTILPAAMPPTAHLPLPQKSAPVQTAGSTGHASANFSKPATANRSGDSRVPAGPTVITAPPQMAGPNELAARAKEAAAAAAAAKLKADNDDDDDDVTRALLAAAAGVTYTRVQGPNGREQVRASITKPPLTPMSAQPVADQSAPKLATNQATIPAAPVQVTPVYRSTSTSTAQQQQLQPLYQQQLQQQQQQEQQQSGKKKKRYIRVAAGVTWEDPTLADWDPNDFRIFCGDLGNEVSDDTLTRAFNRYASFQKARIVRDKRTGRSRGYGFVSFSDPADFTRAMREMNGKYVGNRPIKLKRSDWRTRQLETVRKKEKEKKKLGLKN